MQFWPNNWSPHIKRMSWRTNLWFETKSRDGTNVPLTSENKSEKTNPKKLAHVYKWFEEGLNFTFEYAWWSAKRESQITEIIKSTYPFHASEVSLVSGVSFIYFIREKYEFHCIKSNNTHSKNWPDNNFMFSNGNIFSCRLIFRYLWEECSD